MRRRAPWSAALIAGAAVALGIAPTAGWSQIYNQFSYDPANYVSCTDPGGHCVQWDKTANNMSITVLVYFDSISLAGASEDLKADALAAIRSYNGAPARNPIYRETTDRWANSVYVERGDATSMCQSLSPVWACTRVDSDFSLGYNTNGHRILGADLMFDRAVSWNHTWTSKSPVWSPFDADSRKVAAHEIGHTEALGHTALAVLMHQGFEPLVTLQSNDILGLKSIYGAYP
jgi:hypothetical protein